MIARSPEILIEGVSAFRTFIVFARQTFTCVDGVRIRRTGVSGILVGLRWSRVRHVVKNAAKETVHPHAEEHCIGVFVAKS